jgi:predicted site-specific integrase-resolvase
MTKAPGWVSVQKAEELLGIDRKTLFKYRDDGTLKLGPHFAAFPETRSRDSYRWNVSAVRKQLEKQRKSAEMPMS